MRHAVEARNVATSFIFLLIIRIQQENEQKTKSYSAICGVYVRFKNVTVYVCLRMGECCPER